MSAASTTQPSGEIINFAPNALGQSTQVTSPLANYATGVSYHPNGALAQFTYGNAIVHRLTQSLRGLPDVSEDSLGSGASAKRVLQDAYDFDGHGNVAGITDGATNTGGRGNRTMTYDALDRLKTATSPMFAGAFGNTATYTYDALDNLTRVVARERDHHYCYDGTLRLTNVRKVTCSGGGLTVHVLGYEKQGNLANKDGQLFDFDYGNRLRSATGKETYRYDGHGRRVQATSSAGLADILSQYGRDGVLRYQQDFRRDVVSNHVYLAGSLIATRETPMGTSTHTIKYQHTDALGSPVVVTNSAGQEVERSDYEAYGALINRPLANGPGYTGHVSDKETGLSYMQQRYYDPEIGRFLSVDPVAVDLSGGANFNRYRYAADNPYRFTDPDGRHERQGEEWNGYGASKYVQATVYDDFSVDLKKYAKPAQSKVEKNNAVRERKVAEESRWDMRKLHDNEAAAAKKMYPKIDTGKIRTGYSSLLKGGMTPRNAIWFPRGSFSKGPCEDMTTCQGGRFRTWFTHEVGHVSQFQSNWIIGPVLGHVLSSDILTFGDYLSRDEYLQLPTPEGLNTEEEADWHMWKHEDQRGAD